MPTTEPITLVADELYQVRLPLPFALNIVNCYLLRDADGDGVAEVQDTFLEELNQPFGMALLGDTFYVGNADGVVAFPYTTGARRITVSCICSPVNSTVRNVSFSCVRRSMSPIHPIIGSSSRSHARCIEALRFGGPRDRGGGGNRTPVAGRPSGSSPGAAGGEISPRASHRRRGPRPARVRCPSEVPGRNLVGEACSRCPSPAAGPPGRTAT